MELIFEFIGTLIMELLFEGAFSIIKNKKISLWIRIPILILLILLFSIVIFGIIALGIYFIKINLVVALLFITIGLIILVASLTNFKKQYIKYKYSESNKNIND